MGRLDGKTALVTGGGRGIGRGIALAYAREGADVAIVARSRPEPEEVASEIRSLGCKGIVLTADLTLNKEAQRVVQEAIEGLGKVDILVNNVGGYRLYTDDLLHHLPVMKLSEEEWHWVITGNFLLVVFNSSPEPLQFRHRGASGMPRRSLFVGVGHTQQSFLGKGSAPTVASL